MTDGLAHYDFVGDGERVLWGVRIAWVIRDDGTQDVLYEKDGEDPVRALVVGALEAVKAEVMCLVVDAPDEPTD